ncbi:MAG: cellulase family glycosylhydrolase [Bacteroidales bacterium]
MNNLIKYILFFLFAPTLHACSEKNTNVFADKPFALITAEDGLQTSISARIDDQEHTIDFTFCKESNITSIDVTFQLNPGFSMVSPITNQTVLDLSDPVTITVTSESGNKSYKMTALNEAPVLTASFIFRDQEYTAEIDHEKRTLLFPINSIYASEYPEELLNAVSLKIETSDGYTVSPVKETYSVSGDEKITLTKGRNTYTYQLLTQISPLAVQSHLPDFQYKRGVNLAYWMVVDGSDRDWLGYINPKSFPLWKELGFDHFRVPVKESVLFNEDGSFHQLALDKLHELFEWCEQNAMYAILDMHELSPRQGQPNYREEDLFDPAYPEFSQNYIDKWAKISSEFKKHNPKYLAYELLNEPHDGTEDAAAWNKLQKKVLTAIRSQEPERIVFVPSMGWQDYNFIKYAEISPSDPNVIISFHYYLPMLLSHYKMLAWIGYQGAVQYPGLVIPTKSDADAYPKYASFHTTNYNAQRIMGEMGNAAADGNNIGRTVHCGEFGCSKQVAEEMRMQWFSDMVTAMETNNIPWTLWESLGGGFGFVDENGSGANKINCRLLQILTGKSLTESEAKAILEKYGYKTY